MPRGHAVIDITTDPHAARAERRRAALRIGVPILGVVAMVAVILLIAIQANRANTRGALALADDVLGATVARIEEEVADHFRIAARALAEGRMLAEREPPGEPRRELIEKFSIPVVRQVPQITGYIIAHESGDFMMVWQNDATGGIDTKLIQNDPGTARRVLWVRRNPAGEVISRTEDPTDLYDPRTRAWFSGALKTQGIFWSDVYLFYTANQPGITAATRYETRDGEKFVVAVDITVSSLSQFLANLKVGRTGRAMLVDGDGRIIAHPQIRPGAEAGRPLKDTVAPRIIDIGDAAAANAYDRFRVMGPSQTAFELDGRRYLAAMRPLQNLGRGWSVLVVLPEKEFIGFIARNNRTALLMSLAIVAIAVLMAALLIRQGLRGDRAARLLRERTQAIARRSEALDRIEEEADLFDPDRPEQPLALTESAAEIAGARRASLWYLQPQRNVLRCADSFDTANSLHAGGFELHRAEVPHFFDEIAAGGAIETANAASDARTAEAHRLLMAPLGSRSLATIPMRHRGKVVGAIGLEDATGLAGARHFLRMLAGAAAGRAMQEDHVGSVEVGGNTESHPEEPAMVRSSSADLSRRGSGRLPAGEATYPEVSVLVMRMDEPATGANGGGIAPELVDAVAREIQKIAAEQDIPYVKLVGCDIVGAAGFATDDETGPLRIANAAVAIRDRLAVLFASSGIEPDFRLGIDCGVALGRLIGSDPALFNLWGDAVQTAHLMAVSALRGAIQTSEAAYSHLQEAFLLRPRGTFYLPARGMAKTFVLAGRL
jgi:class 3 adenylate cyclase